MPTARRRHNPSPRTASVFTGSAPVHRAMAALLIAVLSMAAIAPHPALGQATQPAAEGQSVDISLPDDDYAALKKLTEMAPSRQVGQPGNEKVDELVRRRFERAVQSENGGRDAAAQEAVQRADAARQNLEQAQFDLQRLSSETGAVVRSAWYVQYTLEDPVGTTTVLVLLGLVLAGAGYLQKRRSVYIFAASVLAAGVLLPALAWLIETETEAIRQSGTADVQTRDNLFEQRDEAMRAAMKADLAAARELEGLWQHGRISYPVTTFVPGPAELRTGAGESLRLHQMAPNMASPSNVSGGSYEGPMVYLGEGTPEDLAGKTLDGAVALMEFTSEGRWLDAVELGAELIVFVGPGDGRGGYAEASKKFSFSPVHVPRFYVRRGEVQRVLGEDWQSRVAQDRTSVAIEHEPGKWTRKEVATDWLFIPARADAGVDDQARETPLVHFQAYKDSASIVPELAPGAQSGANLLLLLRMVEHFRENPPARPVLLSAVNGHAQALRGENMFAFSAFAEPSVIREELRNVDRELEMQRFTAEVFGQSPTQALIEKLRRWTEPIGEGGRMFTVKEPMTRAMEKRRNTAMRKAKELRTRLEQSQDAREEEGIEPTLTKAEEAELQEQIQTLQAQADSYVPLMRLFNKFGRQRPLAEVKENPEQWRKLRGLFEEVASEARRHATELAARRRHLTESMKIRRRLLMLNDQVMQQPVEGEGYETLLARRYSPLPSAAVFCLDLAFGSDEVGFFSNGNWAPAARKFLENATQRVSDLSRYTLNVAEDYSQATGQRSHLISTLLNAQGLTWRAHLSSRLVLGSRPVHGYARPGLTLTSVQDGRPQSFSPQDTPARIERDHYDHLMRFARGYLPRLANAEGLAATRMQRGSSQTLNIELSMFRLDEFSVNLANNELPGALVMAWTGESNLDRRIPFMYGQVQPCGMFITDAGGKVMLRGEQWQDGSVQAFGFDDSPEQRVNASLDLGEGERRFPSTLAVRGSGYVTRQMVLIQADKVDLFGMTQALTLLPASELDVLEAQQNGTPRNYSIAGVNAASSSKLIPMAGDGTASVFLEPASRFKLMLQGAPVVNATEEKPEGVGFPSSVGKLNNLSIQPAVDMYRMNDHRLNELKDKGVTDETTRQLNDQAGDLLEQMREAREAERPDLVQLRGEEARGLGFRAYTMTVGTINDLIKAVIIVLGLVIPVSFFLMKLITPFTDINRQLGLFGLMFAALAVILQFVHPAFEIASTPQVVVLAFIILGLALFVASVLISRFNTSMTQAIEESQMSEGTEAPRGRLAGVAFMVGVNNMKRRRIRTTLTAATVVLVTFTSLSVMSVGRSVEPAQLRLGQEPQYDGFLFTRSAMGPIDPSQMANLRAHFEHEAQTVRRVWVQKRGQNGGYLPYMVRPESPRSDAEIEHLRANVVLGLEKEEHGFIRDMPLAAGRWFSSDDASEVVLSVEAARLLGFTPADVDGADKPTFWVMGRKLELVGLLEDEPLTKLKDLGETSVLPLISPPTQDAAEQRMTEGESSGTESLDPASGAGESAPGIEPARPVDVAIVPTGLALRMQDATLRSLSVKYTSPEAMRRALDATSDDTSDGAGQAIAKEAGQSSDEAGVDSLAAKAWKEAVRMIGFQHARIQVSVTDEVPREVAGGADPGQYAIASSSATQVGGILKVAIPIALGATIIFNTMLGAVMERRREISIYNAIGLNPTHVMVFFLAESLVYGLVGAVAGYLIGQILSVVITNWLPLDIQLNYSSLAVMLVIFITIATVLLSTVYPAAMAARAAVPSGQRKWSLPQPEGDEIHVAFPFLYDDNHVLGVCAYLRDFMQQNTEASTGKFLASEGSIGIVPTKEQGGRDQAMAMVFDVAPAPYDLGVNQKMEVYASYDARVGAYMLNLHLTRLSGEKNNWVTVNQPFLEALRKRLLGWRSQREDVQQAFCEQGQQLFADAPKLPTADESTDQAQGPQPAAPAPA